MEFENLKSAAKKIMMPEAMKHRIAHNCKKQILNTMEEHTMNNRKDTSIFRKPAAVFAALAVCLSLSVTTLASTGVLKGYFRDITNFSGAIVGTSYEQATDEISMDVRVNGNELTVLATFLDASKFPYREVELLGVAEYKIMNVDGKVVKEGASNQAYPVLNGQTAIVIDLNDIEAGSYKFVVNAFVAEKKAEQPLMISGSWNTAFSK